MISLAQAGEAVTTMVSANTKVILGTKTLGRQRQRDSRNVLMESVFNHFELVSMLAVAIDRLAVYQALTPSLDIERVADILRNEFEKRAAPHPYETPLNDEEFHKIAQAVLDR
jgi:hypothetical protein